MSNEAKYYRLLNFSFFVIISLYCFSNTVNSQEITSCPKSFDTSKTQMNWEMQNIPISTEYRIIRLSVKDEKMINSDALSKISSGYIKTTINGMPTYMFLAKMNEDFDTSSIFSISTKSLGYTIADGGVWSRGDCHDRHCETECRDCGAGANYCKDKFDRICGGTITCWECQQ